MARALATTTTSLFTLCHLRPLQGGYPRQFGQPSSHRRDARANKLPLSAEPGLRQRGCARGKVLVRLRHPIRAEEGRRRGFCFCGLGAAVGCFIIDGRGAEGIGPSDGQLEQLGEGEALIGVRDRFSCGREKAARWARWG